MLQAQHYLQMSSGGEILQWGLRCFHRPLFLHLDFGKLRGGKIRLWKWLIGSGELRRRNRGGCRFGSRMLQVLELVILELRLGFEFEENGVSV